MRDAQEPAREAGAAVSPALKSWNTSLGGYVGVTGNYPVFLIDFDVAVTATEGTGTGAEAKVEVVTLFRLKAGGRSNQSEERTSRVKFQVPFALPVEPASQEERDHLAREKKAAREKAEAEAKAGKRGTSWMAR